MYVYTQIYFYAQCHISTIVISQSDDVTICEGKGAVFSCVLNTTDADINNTNVQWYRLIMDTGTTEFIYQRSSSIRFTVSTINNTLTSSLTITNARKSYTGYYWVRLPSDDVCNVSLTVVTSTYMNRVDYTCTIYHKINTKQFVLIFYYYHKSGNFRV